MSTVAALPFSAWPTGRKIAAGVFAIAGYIALACAAVYLAGLLFLVYPYFATTLTSLVTIGLILSAGLWIAIRLDW